MKLHGRRDILFVADVFNLFDRQTVTDYNNWYESTFASLNPDFGQAGASSVIRGQQLLPPRELRIGVRLNFWDTRRINND